MKRLYEKPSMAINKFNVTEYTNNITELSSISHSARNNTVTTISKDGIVKLDLSKLNS